MCPALDDHIQATLAADVTLALMEAERRAPLPAENRVRVGPSEVIVTKTGAVLIVYRCHDSRGILLQQHPDYANIWYALESHCIECRLMVPCRLFGSYARVPCNIVLQNGTEFKCAICGRSVEDFVHTEQTT